MTPIRLSQTKLGAENRSNRFQNKQDANIMIDETHQFSRRLALKFNEKLCIQNTVSQPQSEAQNSMMKSVNNKIVALRHLCRVFYVSILKN